MAFSVVQSRAIAGLTALPVSVETDLANGLPQFSIVGLPDAAVREAKERVRSAIGNSGFEFPQRRITVNLAPADLPKDSGRFDLAIALGILAASDQLKGSGLAERLSQTIFVGELSLTGQLLPIRGAFAMAAAFLRQRRSENFLLLPLANQAEASLIGSDWLCFAADLRQAALYLKSCESLSPVSFQNTAIDRVSDSVDHAADWSDIRGQSQAKRAALIAAAGHHNFLMLGPPGVGKSLVAARITNLLPGLSHEQACTLAALESLTGGMDPMRWRRPPFRAPHHSISSRALIGGGQPVRPGEVSLAHHGVLFLDELPEFSRDALESLREPLETTEISIARVRDRVVFPADVMLVAAMNPCPCGYFGAQNHRRPCRCSPDRILRYRDRISGPLMDRFDVAVQLQTPTAEELMQPARQSGNESCFSDPPGRAVCRARDRQMQRQSCVNARLEPAALEKYAALQPEAEGLMIQAASRWGWSARAWHRALRVARTIADFENSEQIQLAHMAEAVELRRPIDIEPDLRACG